MQSFTLRMPDALAEGVKQLSEKEEITKTQLIRDAIKKHLEGAKN